MAKTTKKPPFGASASESESASGDESSSESESSESPSPNGKKGGKMNPLKAWAKSKM